MRIITGRFKGRRIDYPKIPGVRPTRDFIKEKIFNILQFHYKIDWANCRLLDFCAGSGQMGLEALSYGAAHVTFVDNNPLCLQNIRKTVLQLKLDAREYGIASCLDTSKFYHVCFMDPPYADISLYQSTLNCLKAGLIVAEMGKKQPLITNIPYVFDMEKISGSTKIVFLKPPFQG